MRRSPWAAALLAVTLLVCGAVLVQLFQLSVERGEVFPDYSSLRAEPTGVKALHDSLASLPGYKVERWFRPIEQMRMGGAVLLYLDDSLWSWRDASQKTLTEWEDRAKQGVRVVVSLRRSSFFRPPQKKEKEETKAPPVSAIEQRWKLQVEPSVARAGTAMFAVKDGAWDAIAHNGTETVAVERSFGNGSIVLLADGSLFTNEALRRKRDTARVLWALGGYQHVVFDESHLGTVQAGSVGLLLRRYGLQGAVFILLIVGGLFVWRSAVPLLPAASESKVKAVEGRGAEQALTSLLRRAVTKDTAGGAVLELWKKSGNLLPGVSPERRRRVEQELEATEEKGLLSAWERAHRIVERTL